MSRKIVHLRVIKGSKKTFNEDVTLANENQIVKLEHGRLEWQNYMENLHRNGFCEAHAEKVIEYSKDKDEEGNYKYKEVDVEKIEAEVQAIMKLKTDSKKNVAEKLT